MSTTDAQALLEQAEDLDFGLPKTALIEEAVAHADAGTSVDLQVRARLALLSAYNQGGEPLKVVTPFTWLLQRYDEDRSVFDDSETYALLWAFKGVSVFVTRHPEIPRGRIEATLDDMERRYADAGERPAPVLGCRAQVVAALDGHDAAAEYFAAWAAEGRTPLSDCAGCEPTVHVEHLVATGRLDEVLAEAEPVLRGHVGCSEQPMDMIDAVIETLPLVGTPEQARAVHLRGVRLARARPPEIRRLDAHVAFCVRTGNHARALDLLREELLVLGRDAVPSSRLTRLARVAAACRVLTEAGLGEREVPDPDTPSTTRSVAASVEPLTSAVRGLAARFDARNGNDVISRRTEVHLEAGPLPHVPMAALSPAVADAPDPGRDGTSGAPQATESATPVQSHVDRAARATTRAQLLALVEEATLTGHEPTLTAVTEAAAARSDLPDVTAPGATRDEQLAAVELDQIVVASRWTVDEPSATASAFRSVADQYDALGEVDRAALCRLFAAGLTHDSALAPQRAPGTTTHDLAADSTYRAMRSEMLELAAIAGGKDPVRRARAAMSLAISLPPEDEAVEAAVRDAIDALSATVDQEQGLAGDRRSKKPGGPAQAPPEARRRLSDLYAMLSSIVLATGGDPDEAATHATKALAVLGDDDLWGHRARAQMAAGQAARVAGDVAGATESVQSARDDAEKTGDRKFVISLQLELAGFVAAGGDGPRALTLLEDSLAEVDRVLPHEALRARSLLVELMSHAGRTFEAAEIGEAALAASDGGDVMRHTLAHATALATLDLGDGERAARLATDAADGSLAVGHVEAGVESLMLSAHAFTAADDPAASLAAYERLVRVTAEAGLQLQQAAGLRESATRLAELARPSEALDALTEAERVLDASGAKLDEMALLWNRAMCGVRRAQVHAQAGQFDEALAASTGIGDELLELGDHDNLVTWLHVASLSQLRLEQPDDAVTTVRDGLERLSNLQSPAAANAAQLLVQLLDQLGRTAEADIVHAEWSADA